MKKTLITAAQIFLGAGLIFYLFWDMQKAGKIANLIQVLKNASGNWMIISGGILLFGGCLLMCIMRWQILLKAQDIHLPLRKTTMLYFVGHFFSPYLPGATSGDLFKSVYIAGESPDKKAEAVATVFIDRVIGLIALLGLATVITLFRFDYYLLNKQTVFAMIFNISSFIAAITGLVIVFNKDMFMKFAWFRNLENKTAGKIIRRVYDSFHTCIKAPSIMVKTLILSVMNHIFLVICSFMIGIGLNIKLGLGGYITVMPTVNALSAIPIAPGGLGVRDTAAKYLLGALNVAEEFTVPLTLIIYFATVFWSLIGGVIYFYYIIKKGRPIDTGIQG